MQTSPISFVARGKGPFSACNKGNRRRLHAGKFDVILAKRILRAEDNAPLNVNPMGGSAGKGWGFDA